MSILVIGAGMAGLAAARDLHDAGETVTVLEARERTGGRVYTDHQFAGIPVEFGAEFIHGDLAPTWTLVRKLGLRTLLWRKTDDSLVRMADGSLHRMQDARLDSAFDITRAWNLEDVPALPDEDWGSYLRRIGFTNAQLDYVRRSFANAVGDSMQYTSAEAILAELRDESNGEGDFRILDGYSALTDYLAEGLDIRLNTVVERIDWSGKGVQVQTNQGVFAGHQLVITLPIGVLQSGKVEFFPALPPKKHGAIANLRMGPVIKLVYQFEQPITPDGIMAIFSSGNPPMWWSPSFGQDIDQVVWTAFVSGDGARDLLALGETGALEKALDTLRDELDCPDLQAVDKHLVNWPADPYALGGYSVATPGHADARRILAQPTDNKLFWAGEATAERADTATVHGAYLSGKRVASEILANNHQQ